MTCTLREFLTAHPDATFTVDDIPEPVSVGWLTHRHSAYLDAQVEQQGDWLGWRRADGAMHVFAGIVAEEVAS
jgi:hypothetical protein